MGEFKMGESFNSLEWDGRYIFQLLDLNLSDTPLLVFNNARSIFNVKEGECMGGDLEDLLLYLVLRLLHPQLPKLIREKYSERLKDSKRICEFKSEILVESEEFLARKQAEAVKAEAKDQSDPLLLENNEPLDRQITYSYGKKRKLVNEKIYSDYVSRKQHMISKGESAGDDSVSLTNPEDNLAIKMDEELVVKMEADNLEDLKTELPDDCPSDFLDHSIFDNTDVKDYLDDSTLASSKISNDSFRVFSCKECHQEFESYAQMTRHTDLLHGQLEKPAAQPKAAKVPIPCNMCGYLARTKNVLKLHIQSKHLGMKYSCDECNYTVGNERSMVIHIESVHAGIRYYCDQCDYTTDRKPNLTTHMKSRHSKETSLLCDKCEYSTNLKAALNQHYNRMHNPNRVRKPPGGGNQAGRIRRMYKSCDYCDFTTNRIVDLNLHITTIHPEVDHKRIENILHCDQCEYTSLCKFTLRDHMARKHNVGKHACDECEFVGSCPRQLKEHKEKHGTFPCSECDYVATFGPDLRTHKREHEDRPYACTLCDYASSRSDVLRSHMDAKHDTGTRMQCDQCPFTTRVKGDMRSHKKTHDENRSYPCDLCDFKARYKASVDKHKKRIHPVIQELL